ncbi:MAG TPA: GntR family transcriptional regulator [Anaerolineales bacterium]|nr:GntR family transcriptional regulator [Anaerolineales bacterium]
MAKKSNLSTDIFNRLKERIIYWIYLPGHRLTEEALCEEFGVSRSPIREVLGMLIEQGLVEKEPHKGYSVKQLDMGEILELYDVRLALELYVVEWLATNGMDPVVWQDLHERWTRIRSQPNGQTDFTERDERFHSALVEATGNTTLLQHYDTVCERLHFIRLMDITSDEKLLSTCEQHLRILECIKKGDGGCARQAIRRNIEDGRSNVDQAVKEILAKTYMGKTTQT